MKEKLSQHEWNDPANLPSGPSDAPYAKDCCDCGWHCIAGSSPESCKAQHAQHVASLAGPADPYHSEPCKEIQARYPTGKIVCDCAKELAALAAGASLAGTEPPKHEWHDMKGDKPWTCKLCGFYTSNNRHIENGFCRHDWGVHLGMFACGSCGVVKNERNEGNPCIGKVKVDIREGLKLDGKVHIPEWGQPVAGTEPEPRSERLKFIIEKCEQYWNEPNIGDAEVHAILENIHRNARETEAEITAQRTALTLNAEECNEWAGKVLGLEAEIAALRERVNGAGLSFLAIKMTSEEYARKNNLAGKPVWQNIAEEALLALKTSASSGTEEGR